MSDPTSSRSSDRPIVSNSIFADLVYKLLNKTTLDAGISSIKVAEAWGVALSLEIKAMKIVGETLKEQGMMFPAPKETLVNSFLDKLLNVVDTALKDMGVEIPGPKEETHLQRTKEQEPKTPVKSRLPVPKSFSSATPKKLRRVKCTGTAVGQGSGKSPNRMAWEA